MSGSAQTLGKHMHQVVQHSHSLHDSCFGLQYGGSSSELSDLIIVRLLSASVLPRLLPLPAELSLYSRFFFGMGVWCVCVRLYMRLNVLVFVPLIPDLRGPDQFQKLEGLLKGRGYSESRIDKILGGNFYRLMTETWG